MGDDEAVEDFPDPAQRRAFCQSQFDRENKMAKIGEVKIFGPIGESFFEEGITTKKFSDEVEALGKVDELRIVINSGGGNLFDGLGIFNIIAQHKAKTVVEIAGVAGSAAALISVAADEVEAGEVSSFFIHNTQGLAMGDRNDMEKTAEIMGKFDDIMRLAFVKKTGQSDDKIRAFMDKETNFTAKEAKELGFIDELIEVRADSDEKDKTTKADIQKEIDAMLKELGNDSQPFMKLAASSEGLLNDVELAKKSIKSTSNLPGPEWLNDPFKPKWNCLVADSFNRNEQRFCAAMGDLLAKENIKTIKVKPHSKIELTDGKNVFLYTEGEIAMWAKVQSALDVDSPEAAEKAVVALKAKIKDLESAKASGGIDVESLTSELQTMKVSLETVRDQLTKQAERIEQEEKDVYLSRLETLISEGFLLPGDKNTYSAIAKDDHSTFDALEKNLRSREPQYAKLTEPIPDSSSNEPTPSDNPMVVVAAKMKELQDKEKMSSAQAENWIQANDPKLWVEYTEYVNKQAGVGVDG